MKHLVNINDFTVSEIKNLIKVGEDISKNTQKYSQTMKGKILATLFFEPSTRTRLSFESAMLRLGGQVLGFAESANSSISKGESIKDTVRTVEQYADLIAMRHPKEGSASEASSVLNIPLINGGDGGNQHPTQTLTDLLTIQKEKGTLSGLKIAMIGDLKNGRTVHSLTNALHRMGKNEFMFVSPEELKMPDEIKETLPSDSYTEHETIDEVISTCDIIYMTRIQKERFFDTKEYDRLKDVYVLDNNMMSFAKKDAVLMHPLPRVNEIKEEVDQDPRAKYFSQAKNGVFVRMALIMKLVLESEYIENVDALENFVRNDSAILEDYIQYPQDNSKYNVH